MNEVPLCKIAIHLRESGNVIETSIYQGELDDSDQETVEDLIEGATEGIRPGWTTLGDVSFFAGSVAAIQIIETY